MDAQSGKQQTITSSTDLRFLQFAWYPDGSGLVVLYSEGQSDTRQIGFVSYPSGGFRSITHDTNSYSSVSISADGKALATVQTEDSVRLYLMPSGESTEERATPITPRGRPYRFVWADDNSLVLENSRKFYRINDRGEGKELLMDGAPIMATWLAPCQGGRYVAFMAKDPKSTSGFTSLWRLDSSSHETTKLTDGQFDASPVCSPDGKWVYYAQPNDSKLGRVSIDGGSPKTIISGETPPGIDVSRDGKLLTSWSKVIDAHTGRLVREIHSNPLANAGNGLAQYSRFTPRGDALAYSIRDENSGTDNLWAFPLDGSTPTALTSFKADEIYDFHWSPSGQRLGIVRGRTESNVVLIRETNP